MIKSLRTLLLATLAVVLGGMQANAQESKTATWLASSKDAMPTIYVGNDLVFTWDAGSAVQAPVYSTQSKKDVVSMQSGSKLTIKGASEDVKISQIVFTYVGDNVGLTPSVGSSSNSFMDNTSTWTGEENSITFTANGRRYVYSIEVTYTGEAAEVEKAPELKLTSANIADTYDMDQNPVFVVYYENAGTAAAENAKLIVYVDSKENAVYEIGNVAIGATGFVNAKYNLESLEAGDHSVYVALTADNAETVKTVEKTVTFTKKAPEATFAITAENVTVQLPVDKIEIKATVKNTSEVNAENVVLNLWRNGSIATETIEALAAGAEQEVTFTIDPLAAGEYNMQVLTADNKYGTSLTLTVLAAPVEPVYDLAITAIDGTIKLAEETASIRVSVQNNGNQNITDAPVKLTVSGTTVVLGETTVSANAGSTGFCSIGFATSGLEAGSINLTATVTVENDVTPDDNTMEKDITVEAKPAPEATYSVTAENVSVPFDALSFEIKATVKNTSDVAAENVEVKLMKSVTVIETKTIEKLAAGEETEVVFTVNEIGVQGKTVSYFVQVANKAQAEVEVTFEEEPVEPVVDLTLTSVSGLEYISLQAETNTVSVWYKNNGNTDITDAKLTMMVDGDQKAAETIAVKAEKSWYAQFNIPTEGLKAGKKATVVFLLTVADDVNMNDNVYTKVYEVYDGEPVELSFEVTADDVNVAYDAESFDVKAVVKNTSTLDAYDIPVKLVKGTETIATRTIDVAAGQTYEVVFTVEGNVTPGTTTTYQVQVNNNKAGVNFDVIVEEAPIVPEIDMAITSLQGITQIDMQGDNKVMVWYENKSNIDLENVAIMLFINDNEYARKTVDVIKAGQTGHVDFELNDLDGFIEPSEDEVVTLLAWVNVDGDIDASNNKQWKEVPVVGTTTGIRSVMAAFGADAKVFTLGGQKVNTVEKGKVYIVNGKKMFVK